MPISLDILCLIFRNIKKALRGPWYNEPLYFQIVLTIPSLYRSRKATTQACRTPIHNILICTGRPLLSSLTTSPTHTRQRNNTPPNIP